MLRLALWVLFISIALTSCHKPELIIEKAPETLADTIIPQVKAESYVSRLYIDLLGRKPSDVELQMAVSSLMKTNVSETSRASLYDQIASNMEFTQHLYSKAKQDYLNGIEDAEIQSDLKGDSFQIQYAIATKDRYAQYYWEGVYKLRDSVLQIPADLQSGKINYRQMLRRIILNPYYDDINMGVANFSFAVYESFLFRAPTTEEWKLAQDMCNGSVAVIMGKSGSNKADFTDICLGSNNFYEGQVNINFNQFLKRKPNSGELYTYTQLYFNTNNIAQLIKSLVISKEYFNL